MKSAAIEESAPARGPQRGLAFVVAISLMFLLGAFSAGSVSAAPKTGSLTTDVTSQLPAG